MQPSTTAGGSLLASTGTGPQIKAPPPPRGLGTTTSLDAFFRGAGLSPQKLDEKQTDLVLHLLGQVMREVILGLGESLTVRAEQKSAMRLPNTTIQPQNNNPLKFAAGVEESMNKLLFGGQAEYMSAVDAVREAFLDIKAHQQSMLSALKTALTDYVGRLDPDDLENKFSNGKRSGLLNAANKLKYWDLYKDLFQVVTQQTGGQLPQLFIDDLARAYEHESGRGGGPQGRKPQAKVAS
jgi:type VI secretion system protein